MRLLLLWIVLLSVVSCDQPFEPLSGWKANVVPARRFVQLDLNGREKRIAVPGGPGTTYRYPQWSTTSAHLFLAQLVTTDSCYDYRLIAIDTTGAITDTLYTPPPGTALNFKVAPNDSIVLLKTYKDNCVDGEDYKYTFFNRFTGKALADTIRTGSSRGILFPETVWSPDSKKVILSRRYGKVASAFVYDLNTKDSIRIDKGSTFTWSPVDNEMVAYIKDYSLYSKNTNTGDVQVIYEGKSDHEVTAFRWNPTGEFMMIHIRGYFLNMEAGPFQNNFVIYQSMRNGTRSDKVHMEDKVDTWTIPRNPSDGF